MSRRVLLLLVLVVLVVVGAAVALTVTARPDLEDGRNAVDARWAALRAPLAARYRALGQVVDALGAAGAGDRTYTVDLKDELGTWAAATAKGDPGAEAASADRLEGLATRVRANVAQSARLARDPGVTQALAAFDAALVPVADTRAYNRAVRRYQATRTDTLKQLAADVLGYEARPVLVIGAAAPASG